jgi:IS6 family transposase
VEELLRERGVWVDHTTVFRWVQSDAPGPDKRRRPHLRATNDLYRVDKRYIRIKKQWHYLHRAVDSQGHNPQFYVQYEPACGGGRALFPQGIGCTAHTPLPRVITVDQNVTYPPAFDALLSCGTPRETCTLRQCKYVNNA